MMVLGRGTSLLVFLIVILLQIRSAVGLNFTAGGHEVRCIERERQVLLSFRRGLVDDYGVLSSWGSEQEKRGCCKWRGVQCSKATGRVIELILQDCSLRGKLCPFLFELQSFR
ncbi:hypothetical protein SLEP1_g39420 [Rubroshorea leprosula]|uniref:Leucine-rich repeat-containing N-terminal plant-type domain-containing protein n=1 Tax=Rubroshorea leprosula TaxID=152421 RepID=A0AAV5L0Y5_9ROSI|nr:hypothetical protein SLEP1_g39420 [Rubroshorea leprosula]